MYRYIVDRIEGRFAVIEGENGEISGVELARLPQGISEGSVVVHHIGEWSVDVEATEARRARMRERLRRLTKGTEE